MSLQTRLADFVTAVGTDYKSLRTWMFGSASGSLSGLVTDDKTSLVAAINEVKSSDGGAPPTATETVAGVVERATTAEVTAGTDDQRYVSPLKLAQKLTAWAQPLSSNLTTLSGVASGAFGRTLLGSTDATSARTSLGLATVATSGNAADLTGTLPTSVLPPLAIKETFTVNSQAAMLALTAQRGDVAIRTDEGQKMYMLVSDSPGTLADWKVFHGVGDVVSVAGKTGAVSLAKADVGLSLVDNTADASKPVSTAQMNAINTRAEKSANLSDLTDAATARMNLVVWSRTQIGDFDADLVAVYTAAKTA